MLRRTVRVFAAAMKLQQTGPLQRRQTAPSLAEAARFWFKFGFISFGGPTAQIALLHGELVEKKKWISETRFFHALNFCMLLPGPEAHQLAIYIGWLLHKIRGGVIAGTLFVLPAAFFLWGLTWVYAAYGNIAWVAAIFFGIKPAVMAIVAEAVIRIGSRALKNAVMWTLAALAFVAIFFLKVPFPLVVLTAGIIGLIGGRLWKEKFLVFGQNKSAKKDEEIVLSDDIESPPHTKPSLAGIIKVCVIWLSLWWLPVLLAGVWRGWDDTLFREGLFFSRPVDHGAPVCGIHGRLERAWRPSATYGRHTRCLHQHMDNVRALFSVCVSWWPVHRTTARQCTRNDCTLRNHCRCCRGSDEPGRMVWNAYSAAPKWTIQLVRRYCRDRGFSWNVAMEMEYCLCRPRQRLGRTSV